MNRSTLVAFFSTSGTAFNLKKKPPEKSDKDVSGGMNRKGNFTSA